MNKSESLILTALLAGALAVFPACEEKKPAPANSTSMHDDHDDNDHGHGHGGAVVELGSGMAGAFSVAATRDEGAIAPGGEAAIDATVAGDTSTIAAVRFWIGTEDARGSIKAKAEIEDPAEPNRWHVHVEIPDPLPEGSRLYVEIELNDGTKPTAAFDLKP